METDSKMLSSYSQTLRGAGFRMTATRRAVARVLCDAERWLNPEQILDQGQAYCPSLGLVTVYRTLTLFSELGLIRRVHAGDGCHGYVAAGLAHGHHLVCSGCRQVVEFPGTEDLSALILAVERATGFRIYDHMLELHGLCPQCRRDILPGEIDTPQAQAASSPQGRKSR